TSSAKAARSVTNDESRSNARDSARLRRVPVARFSDIRGTAPTRLPIHFRALGVLWFPWRPRAAAATFEILESCGPYGAPGTPRSQRSDGQAAGQVPYGLIQPPLGPPPR